MTSPSRKDADPLDKIVSLPNAHAFSTAIPILSHSRASSQTEEACSSISALP